MRFPLGASALILAAALALLASISTPPAHAWTSDNGNGTFTNPVLYGDYPDLDNAKWSLTARRGFLRLDAETPPNFSNARNTLTTFQGERFGIFDYDPAGSSGWLDVDSFHVGFSP